MEELRRVTWADDPPSKIRVADIFRYRQLNTTNADLTIGQGVE
jgi:hypothetical protein